MHDDRYPHLEGRLVEQSDRGSGSISSSYSSESATSKAPAAEAAAVTEAPRPDARIGSTEYNIIVFLLPEAVVPPEDPELASSPTQQ